MAGPHAELGKTLRSDKSLEDVLLKLTFCVEVSSHTSTVLFALVSQFSILTCALESTVLLSLAQEQRVSYLVVILSRYRSRENNPRLIWREWSKGS